MNETINETVKQEMLDEFNRQMTKYSLYYVYIGASVFVASFVQVRRKCRLPNITDELSIEANSVDPEQTAPIGAV